ncbi:hypothetical protein DKY63_25480 [Pseudomonas putida]|uniref:Uncharacterized protein n=1 Tax=Pseudomonas putida TaxID=303 RepID=A0A2Z4RQ39_PSEPU|nr:hypothetical protein DKY63_25480 [Pseudomonas putida]
MQNPQIGHRTERSAARSQLSHTTTRLPVGASLLAMDVNDNARHQTARVVHVSIASRLAPTGGRRKGRTR